MKIAISSFLRMALAALGLFFSWPVVASAEGKPAAASITFDQVGAEALKQYKGGAIGVVMAGAGTDLHGLESLENGARRPEFRVTADRSYR